MLNEIPDFFYGTAWKEEKTEFLTLQALECGFIAIDTANQRKHYYEEGVGRAIQKFIDSGFKTRDELFLQTKFTYSRGQDHRKPYDDRADFTTQVNQSFENSLKHLGVDYLDSFLLHGPYAGDRIGNEDLEVWATMEKLFDSQKVMHLGVSNINIFQLSELLTKVRVRPTFVQNRCYASNEWDKSVRDFCSENEIHYQGFSLLTANQREMQSVLIQELSRKYSKSAAQIVFKFSSQIGMIPLTGSSNATHLKEDLDISDFELTPDEMTMLEGVSLHQA